MAVINSLGIGAGSKSAGNITYAHYKGRTIARQRITTNSSNTVAQGTQRAIFKAVEYISRGFANILPNFATTKYGYRNNKFIKLNYDKLAQYARTHPIEYTNNTPLQEMVKYINAYMPDNPAGTQVTSLPIFTSFDLRRAFVATASTASGSQIIATLFDPWHAYKNVKMRVVRILPSPTIPLMTEIDMTYGTGSNANQWTATFNAPDPTGLVRPLFAVSLVIDGQPLSSFYVAQTPYNQSAELEEALEIQEAPPALSARKRTHK